MIGVRFIQKGYDKEFIKGKIEEVTHMQREVLIEDKKYDCQQDLVPVVLDYNIQYKKIEKIIQRYLKIRLTS